MYGEDLLGTGGGGQSSGTTTGPTTTAGETTTTTTGQPCTATEECPEPASPCFVRVCREGACAADVVPNTELPDPEPGNCLGLICDSAGNPIEVEDSKDFPDDTNFCTADSCELGKPKHTPKIGNACGPMSLDVCNDRGDCVECVSDDDCPPGIQCDDYVCPDASCGDGAKNGSETDTDCGGACPDCATGKACKVNSDCKSELCTGLVCQPTCVDTVKNNLETDVDCGGPACNPCPNGASCVQSSDCASGVCNGTCTTSTCNDGQKNGNETGVDCGGPDCPACLLDHLVINEVDYDQPMTDGAEFIEIFNATAAPVSLAGHKLILVDGVSNGVYGSIDLAPAGTLLAGQYLVIGPAGLPIAAGALKVDFAGLTNQVQNGLNSGAGAPDGLALINDDTDTLIDAISYEGAITTANLMPWGFTAPVTLVEGIALAAAVKDEGTESLCRLPNGTDTNSSAADWALSNTPTPGAPNVP